MSAPLDDEVDAGYQALIDRVKELQGLFKEGFQAGFGDLSVLDSIQAHLDNIKASLQDIFTDDSVQQAANQFVESFVLNLGKVTGSIASIGASLGDFLVGAFDKYLSKNSGFLKNKIVYTGLPIKDIFFKYRKNPYPKITPTSKIQILITGGSLGAQILTDTIPYALSMLPKNIIKRLNVIHQVQYDKIKPISDFYKKIGIKAEVSDFFKNIPELLNKSNLFIGRSGASTVVEVGTIACPAIFIPLMHKDKHQVYNAKTLEKIGGAKIILQSDLSIDKLSREIETLINKDILTQMYNNLMKIETIQASDNIIKLINKAITK